MTLKWDPIFALALEASLFTFRWKVPALALLFQLPLALAKREVFTFTLSEYPRITMLCYNSTVRIASEDEVSNLRPYNQEITILQLFQF